MMPDISEDDEPLMEVTATGACIPGYLDNISLPNDIRNEARRAYALTLLLSDNGALQTDWRQHVGALESFLKDGALSANVVPLTSTKKPA